MILEPVATRTILAYYAFIHALYAIAFCILLSMLSFGNPYVPCHPQLGVTGSPRVWATRQAPRRGLFRIRKVLIFKRYFLVFREGLLVRAYFQAPESVPSESFTEASRTETSRFVKLS